LVHSSGNSSANALTVPRSSGVIIPCSSSDGGEASVLEPGECRLLVGLDLPLRGRIPLQGLTTVPPSKLSRLRDEVQPVKGEDVS
jgi:hypothetical protein